MSRLIFILAVLFSVTGYTRTITLCEKADDELIRAKSAEKRWSAFENYFKTYGATCDDGAYAEGIADLAAELLVSWDKESGFFPAPLKNESFRKFVLKHISEMTPVSELGLIMKNAKTKCPDHEHTFCQEVGKTAAEAYKRAKADPR